MKILLGLTGSVATVLAEKLVTELSSLGTVEAVLTESSKHFININGLKKKAKVWTDQNEWEWGTGMYENWDEIQRHYWQKNDPILHINLRDTASALVIAPCSANTLAKLANGICDNLLTSIARAWDFNRPLIIAPAMNTFMWEHPSTAKHLETLEDWGALIVQPQTKMLACNTLGMGAMAEIDNIKADLSADLKWYFPIYKCPGVPTNGHPGAFLCKRKHHTHTGVDLYATDGQSVYAAEAGTVVGIEDFTGVSQQSPWWEDTKCILVEGASGVVCYGEVTPKVFVGQKVKRTEFLGYVKRVLPIGREKPDIKGHSLSMLHIELYPHGKYKAFEELGPKPDDFKLLVDPTPYLLNASRSPGPL